MRALTFVQVMSRMSSANPPDAAPEMSRSVRYASLTRPLLASIGATSPLPVSRCALASAASGCVAAPPCPECTARAAMAATIAVAVFVVTPGRSLAAAFRNRLS